jgi:hypothetical protein
MEEWYKIEVLAKSIILMLVKLNRFSLFETEDLINLLKIAEANVSHSVKRNKLHLAVDQFTKSYHTNYWG